METILKLDDVNVTYVNKEKEVYAVRNASFSIEKGDSLGVVGESGAREIDVSKRAFAPPQ